METFQSLSRVWDNYQAHATRQDLYQNEVINHKRLQIPHPRMELRQFVLTPLSDIASEIIHPKIKKSIGELQLNCTDKSPLSLCQKSLEF